ncbi:MAG: CRISPR-associated helicase Cas3' [Nitrospinae bacterium]|nr:CRISPR-associated helicase Cas3' [Nitrospinota bacterium]
MSIKEPIAHIRLGATGEYETHKLEDHLVGVAELAARFAQEFNSAGWAYQAGLWHDVGKHSDEFQNKIRRESGYDADAHIEGSGRVDHSTAGAIHAIQRYGDIGRILAYLIAGHHAGLPDWGSADSGGKALSVRLDKPELLKRVLEKPLPAKILNQAKPAEPCKGGSAGFALWIRMLFSCLVDADFLDTEAFMDEDKAQSRQGCPPLEQMLPVFNSHMESVAIKAEKRTVNNVRADVLRQCRAKAKEAPGIFSLTVPTGGGKTLSSLAFALDHAIEHGKSRIIYAIPYTSIIEQTADIFRDVFKSLPDAVVEHHSNFESDKETTKSRLASENWDAPLIVTTNVQLFESLFASRTSRCRKLHNIVNSVVILDEAQLLPPEFLHPIINTINLLAAHYGVTVVLSTATQPALDKTLKDTFGKTKRRGLNNVREIMEDVDSLYKELERVDVAPLPDFSIPSKWDELAKQLCGHESVLAIVNTRKDCYELWKRMPEGTIHLSALMCGAHRSLVIKYIKRRLKRCIPTRVISTQLVEAGVDLDFPVVYRALAGLDSIAQAAGRCNREGGLDKGKVVVFVPPKPSPNGLLRFGEDAAKDVLYGNTGDPLERSLFTKYFDRFFDKPNLDKQDIGSLLTPDNRGEVQFREAAEKFRLIDDKDTQAVFVRYNGKSKELIDLLQSKGPERWLLRKLQRYCVSLYRYQFKRLLDDGDIAEIAAGMYAQVSTTLYDKRIGLSLPDTDAIDPENLLR